MTRSDLLRVALALVVAAGVAAVFGAVSMSQDRPGLPVGDLARLGSFSDADPVIAEHAAWTFSLFGDEADLTEDDLQERFTTSFSAGFTAEALNTSINGVVDMFGPIRFVRYRETEATAAEMIGVEDDGLPFLAPIELAPDGRMSAWGLDDLSAPPRLPGWQAALSLLAMGLLTVAAVMAIRAERHSTAWALLVGALLSGSSVLILSQSPVAYSLGRTLPAGPVVIAVWLLLRTVPSRTVVLVALAAAGTAALAVAPAVRDATLIGHPSLVWSSLDSDVAYRSLLSLGSLLAAVSLLGVLGANLARLRTVGPWRRSPLAAVAGIAAVWGAALLAAAVDYAIGEGVFATGALTGVSLGSLVAVPPVVAFHAASSRWNRPELANLVIDLGSGDLQRAVATALEDPDVQVLYSPDGVALCDESGVAVKTDATRMAQITREGQLIGGLSLGSDSSHHPERLHAVTAAVGMALELRRLNEQVIAQLGEVEASRARIVVATDEARRRVERDLHDGAQQQLVALGLVLHRVRRMAAASGNDELENVVTSAAQSLRDIIADIRSVARGSDPPLLAERGLPAALDALVERAPIPVTVEVSGPALSTTSARTVYFVVAEGLTNIAKHADANSAVVRVIADGGVATVEVWDDGSGGAAVNPGGGLQGLQDRTAAANGLFHIDSSETGTLIKAVLPCE